VLFLILSNTLGQILKMKIIISLLILNLIIIANASAEPQLAFEPEFTESLTFNKGEYSKINITGRCIDSDGTEQNGPKNTRPLLDANSPKLHNLEIRTSKFKTLEEHATYKDLSKNDETRFKLSISQTGCDHFGINIKILSKDIFTNTCKDRMLEKLSNVLNQIQFNLDYKDSNHSIQQVTNLKKWIGDTKSIECTTEITNKIGEKGMCMDKGSIKCERNNDPNYLSIESRQLEDDPSYVIYSLSYYQVL
jgi:hypothetical protein